MVDIVYLGSGEEMPELGDETPWLIVEASDDDRYFGTGAATKPTGETVFYISLAEDDITLEAALTAARRWAAKYNVGTIWVQPNP